MSSTRVDQDRGIVRGRHLRRRTPVRSDSPDDLEQALTDSARRALVNSGEGWNADSDLTVHLNVGTRPVSLSHSGFKRVNLSINVRELFRHCERFAPSHHLQGILSTMTQLIYSVVRLWTGHFDYCPYDSWRHHHLCRAASKGGFGTIRVSSEQRALAEIVAAFFEKSIVTRTIIKEEGDYFAQGITYEHIVNNREFNLLTNLFFCAQSLAEPNAWQEAIREFSLPEDQLADALLPDVLRIVFGLRVFHDRNATRIIPDQPYRYLSWADRVYKLAELLIPYMIGNNQSPDEAFPQLGGQNGLDGRDGQPGNVPQSISQGLDQTANPFASTNAHTDAPQPSIQRGGTRAGTSSPPFPRHNLEELDRYYSQRASEVVVETQDTAQRREKKPELLPVGFMDSEPASLRALASSQIDLFRIRATRRQGRNEIRLRKRSEPLEIPLGGDEPTEVGLPHLLLVVDSSSSMGFNPAASTPDSRGKYDLVLLSCYGIFKYIEKSNLDDQIQVGCINFSGTTFESGWHRFSDLEPVKRVLLTYQHGGTVLSPAVIRRMFDTRPGTFLAVIITDGEVGNTPEAVAELGKVVEAGCDLVLLHVGTANKFTEAIRAMDCPVFIVNTARDLVGLSLQIARKRFS